MKIPLERIECELDTLANDDWRETGVSARTIVSIGIKHGMSVYIMAHWRKISQRKHEKKEADEPACDLQLKVTTHGSTKQKAPAAA